VAGLSLPLAAARRTSRRGHEARSKRMAGRVTGSRSLRAEGRADQATGNIKQAGAKIKDASGH
jgi:CsbD-like